MFSRYTERAQRVIVLAQDEARRLNYDYVGTEHLLLGLIREGEGIAAKALQSLGIQLEQVRAEVADHGLLLAAGDELGHPQAESHRGPVVGREHQPGLVGRAPPPGPRPASVCRRANS